MFHSVTRMIGYLARLIRSQQTPVRHLFATLHAQKFQLQHQPGLCYCSSSFTSQYPQTTTMSTTSTTKKDVYLFGFPIAHSAAPTLHNMCFQSINSPKEYKRWSTTKIDQAVLDELRSDSSGGAAVTMPLKAEVMKHLDEISPESYATGACNTVVRVKREDGSIKLVGTNTDFLGQFRVTHSCSVESANANSLSITRRKKFPLNSTPSSKPFETSVHLSNLLSRPSIGNGHRRRCHHPFSRTRSVYTRNEPHLPGQQGRGGGEDHDRGIRGEEEGWQGSRIDSSEERR
jgi:hypothetical protein